MKLKTLRKKLFVFISVVSGVIALLYGACNKKSDTQSELGVNSMLENAKSWFKNEIVRKEEDMIAQPFSVLPSSDYRRKFARMRGLEKLLNWNAAREYRENGISFVITPVEQNLKPFSNNNYEGERSLIFYNDQTGKMKMSIIEIVGKDQTPIGSNIQEITKYSFLNKHFGNRVNINNANAYIAFYDQDYKFEKSFEIKNGTWSNANVKIENREQPSMTRSVPVVLGRATCYTCEVWWLVEVWYDQYGYITGWVVLDEWNECYNNGTPPDGYGDSQNPTPDEDCDAKEQALSSNSHAMSEKESSVDCGNNGNTRTKCYTWKVYTISDGAIIPCYLKSRDHAAQELGTDGRWRFQSLVHDDITQSGTTILYSVSVSGVTPIPTFSSLSGITAQVGTMHLNFTVDISFVCKGFPIVHHDPTSSENSWTVNE